MNTENILLAFALTLLAGLSTGIGSLMALFSRRFNPRFLAASLGFSAGVMIYVAFVEIFAKARETLGQALGEGAGYLVTVCAFFGGIGIIALIDKLIPSYENPHEVRNFSPGSDEVRSHDPAKLERYTGEILAAFEKAVAEWVPSAISGEQRPSVRFDIVDDYPCLRLAEDAPVVTRISRAAAACGKELRFTIAGGGSDANIFNGRGLPTAIVATGMDKVHTVDERVDLANLVNLAELLLALATE